MIENNRYAVGMTTLGSMFKGGKVYTTAPQSVDPSVLAMMAGMPLVDFLAASISAAPGTNALGTPQQITAALTGWTQQDDDAHDRCSLTACRDPLHPGPCKGWKGILHSVAPGTYHTLEAERVKKANERRLKRISDLRAQNKPIPRRLLDEIKPKPAPTHNAQHAQPVPLGQVNQKADLAGGQAHTAGQAVSNAAGVQVKTAPPLPLGPKQKKPTVAGRGPAFVITQPKVTDTYKLDKADKITPQEWAGLSDHDKTTIRNELTAIKARGFGPQQTKADALLLKLYAPNVANTAPKLTPGTPGTITTPKGNVHQVINPTPGKVTLGRAVKTPTPAAPAPSGPTPAAPLPPGTAAHIQHAEAVAHRSAPKAVQSKTQVDAYGQLSKADFDALPPATQKTIRDDLTNAKAKFLDPKKQQAAGDLLDRFGSRNTPPTPSAPPTTPVNAPAVPSATPLSKLPLGHRQTLEKISSGARVVSIGNGHANPGLKQMDKDGLVAWNPTTKQFELTDTGRAHLKAAPPAAGNGAKVPSAPAVKDHSAAALAAATDTAMARDARITALTALTKPQFDALTGDQQRKITDALHDLHVEKSTTLGSTSTRSPEVEKAFDTYTGLRPGVHRLKQAEADFRAGKIDAGQVERALLRARVQDPGSGFTPGSPGHLLEKEAQRVAENNPTLPLWLRAEMIDHPYGGDTYHSIVAATNKYNFEAAPRLSSTDISNIFRATNADLAGSHPIHAEAVKALREHLILTGLRGSPGVPSGSPWSEATRNHVIDNLLHVSGSSPEVPADRLADFKDLSVEAQARVERAVRRRLDNQTDNHAKVGTYITLRQLDGRGNLSPDEHAALLAASERFGTSDKADTYRKLAPDDFQTLPNYAQAAIKSHLDYLQTRADSRGPVTPWTPQDNALKTFPAALAAHLDGSRVPYYDRRLRNASDLANYGTGIVTPADRVATYGQVQTTRFPNMSQPDQTAVIDDLDKIAGGTGNPLQLRYAAQFTKDVNLGQAVNQPTGPLSLEQLVAVGSVDPVRPLVDTSVITALNDLSKPEYDKLNSIYREAIDERVAGLSATSQQAFTAKFHPSAPVVNPTGATPTSAQANVPPHVQAALDTIYGVHPSGKSHTMAHQLSTYGALRGFDFAQLNGQEQGHLLGDLSFIATTAKGPSADKARKLIDRFTPPGTPAGHVPTGAAVPPANAVAGQVRYATPLKGLEKAKDSGRSGDKWISLPGGGRVWGEHGAAGLLLQHTDPVSGEKRYLMVQRGPAISDPGKWTFPGGAIDSKETPHQGATRETIEELGLKDDVFKDALVHGDHTFTVPGHPWKYTTVAASVPTMIKPNLSTAHARAETSDAKWLTEAEIKALDAAGELHHPIAGGKLEQNVISLYPSGGQKLGQVARPGPVTTRLRRLAMPPGGRQAPSAFNAWPHPHKQSKGKNLIPDKATFDAQRQKIKQDRALYDGKTADGRLAAIGAQQGFDDTPTVLDKKEIDRLLATGDYIEAWRGVSGSGGYNWRSSKSNGKTAAQINEEMRSGPAYYGKGIFGNGYYLATQKRVAQQYADGTNGSVARILIPKSAITRKYDQVAKESHANPRTSKAKGNSYEDSTFYDPGRYAAAKGLDGIEIEHHHRSPGGGAGHVAASGKPAFNWLNRSVLIVQKEPG